IRIATDNAKLGLPEIALGIIPGFGGTQLLSRLVGRGKAIEMILTGEPVLAKDMKEIGLINHLVPADELIKEAKGLAMKIAEKGFIAVSSALKAIMFASSNLPEARDGDVRNFDKDLELETSLFEKIFETEDWREGVSAFLEKRQPKFKDK
ncbi:MAG: enoyl-CoA hydratase-related protein, partial [Candidatus Scalindua sediminis]